MSQLSERINAALVAAMRARRMKRKDLAIKLGLARNRVDRILRDGSHNWVMSDLQRWCEAIGIGINVMIEDPAEAVPSIPLKGPIFAIFRGKL